jgi:Spy/CpxP family protein refolding chaperone
MLTRRFFISTAAAAAAATFSNGSAAPAAAAAPKGPSAASLAMAKSLQQSMPQAHLTDDLVQKIAGDIDGYAPVAQDLRKITLHNWDEPDFSFIAGPVRNGGSQR